MFPMLCVRLNNESDCVVNKVDKVKPLFGDSQKANNQQYKVNINLSFFLSPNPLSSVVQVISQYGCNQLTP